MLLSKENFHNFYFKILVFCISLCNALHLKEINTVCIKIDTVIPRSLFGMESSCSHHFFVGFRSWSAMKYRFVLKVITISLSFDIILSFLFSCFFLMFEQNLYIWFCLSNTHKTRNILIFSLFMNALRQQAWSKNDMYCKKVII